MKKRSILIPVSSLNKADSPALPGRHLIVDLIGVILLSLVLNQKWRDAPGACSAVPLISD